MNKIKLKYRYEVTRQDRKFYQRTNDRTRAIILSTILFGSLRRETNKQRAPRYSYRVIEKWDVFLIPHPYTILLGRNGRHEKRKVSIVDRNAGANEEREEMVTVYYTKASHK